MSTAFPPTLKQLRYLSALSKTLHFGKAAELCNVTQSTLSAGLQELESLLDAQLVERNKRLVMLTPLGEEIALRADQVLTDVDDLVGLAATANDPCAGTVHMGVIPTIAPFLLPVVMPELHQQLPRLDVLLVEEKSAELCNRLKSGTLDLVLMALPYPCGDFAELALFDDPFIAAYPDRNAPEGPVCQSMLDSDALLLLDEGHCLRSHALAACGFAGSDQSSALAGTSLHTLVHMVAAGHGMTLLPKMAVTAGLVSGLAITLRDMEDGDAKRSIGLMWRKTNPRAETFMLIADIIKSRFSDPYSPVGG